MDNKGFQAQCVAVAVRDGFRIIRHVGQGLDGLIYFTIHRDVLTNNWDDVDVTKAVSCVKVPNNPTAALDLRREIEVYQALLLLPCYGQHTSRMLAYRDGDQPYLAIEAINGTTLGTMKRTALWIPTVLVWSVLTDLLQAILDLRHSPLGPFHSDLHEENIMLTCCESETSLPRARLIDFGRAKSILDPDKVSAQEYNVDLIHVSMAIRGLSAICTSRDTLVTWLDADWKLIITSCDIRRDTPILQDELASLAALARRRRDAEVPKFESISRIFLPASLESKQLVSPEDLNVMRKEAREEEDRMDTSPDY